MAAQAVGSKTADEVIAELRRRQRAIVEAYMHELVPSYAHHQYRLGDMREAGTRLIALVLQALSEQRTITAGEFESVGGYFRRAVLRGASEQEIVRGGRAWQRVMFEELEAIVGPGDAAVLAELSRLLIQHVDAASEMALAQLAEVKAAMRLTGRDARAQLLDDLLMGRSVGAGGRPADLRACAITESSPLIVISARPVAALPDAAAAPTATVALAHAMEDAVEPLHALRGDEMVVVRHTPEEPQRLADALECTHRRLAADGISLAIGASAVRHGQDAIPVGYEQACVARESVAERGGGALTIAVLDPLDYLFVRGADDTAWELVDPAIRSFVETDLEQSGLLIDTLMAYLESGLNARQAAKRLFVHPNTAHYRLAKIEDLTGRDLRNLADLQAVAIAVRLARRRGTPQA
jgi:hypothetical protein